MKSRLYKLGKPIVVTFETNAGMVYSETAGKYVQADGEPVTLEVFLKLTASARYGSERPGPEVGQTERVMQIVGTSGNLALKLPDALKAGDTGTFTDMGKKQTLKLGNLTPKQIPDVSDVLGYKYLVTISAVG